MIDKLNSIIYLDYNATTPLAEEVIKGISNSLITDWGNPSSSNFYGVSSKGSISKSRNQLAAMLHCSPDNIIFTSGGTEANNMIIHSAVRYFHKHTQKPNSKPHIITSNVEHDSILLPIKHLEEESIITTSIVKVDDNGFVRVEDILAEITPQTCLVTIMYANNETGVIMPIPEIGQKLNEFNTKRKKSNQISILFHTDAAQIIGKQEISLETSNADYITVVGHKFYGPKIGCICAKAPLFPLFYGGGQERGIRSGTENTPMIVGLGIAAELVSRNIDSYEKHMRECRDKLERRLKEVFGDEIVVNCSKSERLPNTSNISFRSLGLEGNLVLGRCGKLLASVGAACHGGVCSQILINSGVPLELAKNAIRLSVGRNTTIEDIETVVGDIKQAVDAVKSINK